MGVGVVPGVRGFMEAEDEKVTDYLSAFPFSYFTHRLHVMVV